MTQSDSSGEPRGTPPVDDPDPQQDPPRLSQRSWIWFMFIVLGIFMFYHFVSSQLGTQFEIPFDVFQAELEAGNVKSVGQQDSTMYTVTLLEERVLKPRSPDKAEPRKTVQVEVVIPERLIEGLSKQYKTHGVSYGFKDPDSQMLLWILINLFPIVLIIGLFWYMTSRVRRQMGPGLFGRFTGNRAKRFERTKDSITFQDVAGLKHVKRELQEVVDFLKSPERFTRIGAKIPKGVLLVGPPGTGKTLLARAVAGEASVPFFSISGSEFIELFVGVGASRVRELFDEAKKASPCIIFIDEIDAVGRSRGTGLGGGHDEREQTLNQILSEMDGFEPTQAVIVLAATNRPDVLDHALVRPGRFDRQVVVELPQREGRKAILKVHTRKIPLADDVDLETIARGTIGFSGADLQNLANEAALMAARESQTVVRMRDFDGAKEKILLGTLRDESLSDEEKKVTAYHEAGHALLAMLLSGADPVHSVTIVPRGRAMGVTMFSPEEDAHGYSRKRLIHRVMVGLGGRAAEEVIFDEYTTGAENDLQLVTDIVEKMVCRWGMSEKLGPVSFRRGTEHVFLGRELGEQKTFSEHTAMLIDDEIRRLLDDAYSAAVERLSAERERLVKLAEELLEREVITDDEIYELLDLPKPARLIERAKQRAAAAASGTTPTAGDAPGGKPDTPPADDIDPNLLGLEGA